MDITLNAKLEPHREAIEKLVEKAVKATAKEAARLTTQLSDERIADAKTAGNKDAAKRLMDLRNDLKAAVKELGA